MQEHFQKQFGEEMASEFTDISQGFLDDDITFVLDEVVLCFPIHWKIFEFYCKEYHKNFNTVILNYSVHPEKITPNDIIHISQYFILSHNISMYMTYNRACDDDCIVGWVKNTYVSQMQGLGYDPQPPLSESCEPLFQTYRDHIRVYLLFYYIHDRDRTDLDDRN